VQLGFHPVALVGRLVQKEEKGIYIQKEKQYKNNSQNDTTPHNTQNRKATYKTRKQV
jgi:hypothetical protein